VEPMSSGSRDGLVSEKLSPSRADFDLACRSVFVGLSAALTALEQLGWRRNLFNLSEAPIRGFY